MKNPELELAHDMGRFFDDPLGFVMYAYPWDKDPSLQLVKLPEPWSLIYGCEYGPDRWACEFLDRLGQLVRQHGFDGRNPVAPIREAVASGHGVGKSAITAWLTNWILSTRPFAQGTVTANTNAQLESKTWAQIAKWTRLSITSHWFRISTGRGAMRMAHKDYPERWFCTAQTCTKENSEAFAGQHAADSTSFYINDEASAIPDEIWEVQEGGLTDGEPMQFAFGNPTRNTGAFYNCFHSRKHRYHTQHVDSRQVQITNKTHLQELIDDYGEDSDVVKVRVRGLFPSQSLRQFIGQDLIDAAYGKSLKPGQFSFAPRIITCDPAWEGDDELVIALRQGLAFKLLGTLEKNDNDVEVANILARLEDEHQADAVILDAGYGTGIVSAGRTMGRQWHLVWFSGKSGDPGCLNKRAEMWKLARDWLRSGGAIPADPTLSAELGAPETVPRLDGKIQIESKVDLKRRGQASGNRADALILSFAIPVQAKDPADRYRKPRGSLQDYNPYEPDRSHASEPSRYDPYQSL